MEENKRYVEIKRVTLLGAFINILLAAVKIIFGYVGHSSALIADGIHSLSDLLSDTLVIIAAKFGGRAPDVDHPYGHSRIETAGTFFLSILLVLVGIGIINDGVHSIAAKELMRPDEYLLWIIILSIVIKEGLYRYTKYVASSLKSELLHANAWHHRSDAASSVAVLIGVGGALLGFTFLDAVAAIVVGLLIIKMGWQLGWSSIRELVDTAVEEKTRDKIENIIQQISGVVSIHQLRTRSMGGNILIDVHVLVAPKLSVSEAHFIAEEIEVALLKNIEAVEDVTVHIDPEEDVHERLYTQVPTRMQMLTLIRQHCNHLKGGDQIQDVTLHYLAGQIDVEIQLPLTILTEKVNPSELVSQYQHALSNISAIRKVQLHFISTH